jgi:8-oxo-dGTP diphosphatase
MPEVEVPRIEKVVAYIVRDERIAVFIHADDADPVRESGLQVPAGTCEPGEEPADAVLREAREESGLAELRIVRYLGDEWYDMRPLAFAVHHRHFFHLAADGPVIDEWLQVERDGGSGPPRPFQFSWLPIREGHVLAAGHGALLGRLTDP